MTTNSEIERIVREEIRPIDDIMFFKMAEDKEFLEELLQVILDEPELIIVDSVPQKTVGNTAGRSLVLDAFCKLGDNRLVNIEVQTSNNTDHGRRVRYHASLITTNNTPPKTDFSNIPNVWVVYIAEFDIYEAGKALYQVDRIVRQTGKKVDNGFAEFYVNASSKDGSRIARLMEVLCTTNVYSEEFPKTSNRKNLIFNDEKEKKSMNAAIQKLIASETEELNQKLTAQSNQLTAQSMLTSHLLPTQKK